MSGQCECRSKFGESCAFCKGSEEEYPWALDPMLAIERAESEYARGKADGMAEANIAQMLSDSFAHGKDAELAKVVAWLRAKAKDIDPSTPSFTFASHYADALERGEHKK